jgi:hypothetical protein
MIGVHGEQFTPLDADHRSICKFNSPNDQNLKLVQKSIKQMVEQPPPFQGKFPKET